MRTDSFCLLLLLSPFILLAPAASAVTIDCFSVGDPGNATTEDGAYTITAGGIAANSITRNAEAAIFLTGEDEWYKAAYYDAVATSYFDDPAGTDVQSTCAAPGATANSTNCSFVVEELTDVESYTGSASPNGAFDQGGHVRD